jgi:uncharacterized HAD superfamily protein
MKALDIDGIVCSFTDEIFIPAMNEVLGTEFVPYTVPVTDWDYTKVFGITKEQEQSVWSSHVLLMFMCIATPTIRGLKLIEDYHNNNLDYCFITSRASSIDDERSDIIKRITKLWVKSALGSDAEVYFMNAHNKHVLAKKLGVTDMFEDNPDTVRLLVNEDILVFMPVYEYNKDVGEHELIRPMENWI